MTVKPGPAPPPSEEMLEIFRQADEVSAASQRQRARDRREAIARAAVTGLAGSEHGAGFIASRALAIADALIARLDYTEVLGAGARPPGFDPPDAELGGEG